MDSALTWAPPSPTSRFNMSAGPVTTTPSELHSMATPAEGSESKLSPWSPENPVFWLAAVVAVTAGLAAFSTSVRVGKASASISLGSTK